LRALPPEELVELLVVHAERCPGLRQALELSVATPSGEVAEAHRLLDTAVSDGTVEYGAKVGAVLDTLQRLLDAGSAADLGPLARRTVDDIGEALEQSGDPSGELAAKLGLAVGLYARACAARPPDAEGLADWLLETAFDGPGRPVIALADFAKPLGDKGLDRIKSTVDDILDAGPETYRREVAQRLLEELAEVRGDVDALVAILEAKPRRVDVSLKIVRVLRAAGRHSEAIAHAARALTPGREPVTQPEGETVALRRKEFDEDPNSGTYTALREAATEAGVWSVQRVAALARLRERAAADERGADELVRTVLGEQGPDEAWRAGVRFGGSLALRVELAELREAAHPAETIPVYRSQVEQLIGQKDPQAYREAAKQLKKLRTLHKRAGTAEEFTGYLADLVSVHRRKTRLIAEVRAARIALPKPRNLPASGSLTS
jgi:hypothetical protein